MNEIFFLRNKYYNSYIQRIKEDTMIQDNGRIYDGVQSVTQVIVWDANNAFWKFRVKSVVKCNYPENIWSNLVLVPNFDQFIFTKI